MSSTSGSWAAEGFQMLCRVSGTSEPHMSARPAATANMSAVPPLRRASATAPMTEAALTAPMVSTSAAGPIWAGTVSSQ
jgi:hypothetical protein